MQRNRIVFGLENRAIRKWDWNKLPACPDVRSLANPIDVLFLDGKLGKGLGGGAEWLGRLGGQFGGWDKSTARRGGEGGRKRGLLKMLATDGGGTRQSGANSDSSCMIYLDMRDRRRCRWRHTVADQAQTQRHTSSLYIIGTSRPSR